MLHSVSRHKLDTFAWSKEPSGNLHLTKTSEPPFGSGRLCLDRLPSSDSIQAAATLCLQTGLVLVCQRISGVSEASG